MEAEPTVEYAQPKYKLVSFEDPDVDTNHPELQGQTVEGFDFVNMNNTVFDEGDTAHGTNISGIIAAKHDDIGINGVSQNLKIMPLKSIQDGYGYTTDAIAAIEYAKEKGVKIINFSWGSPDYNPILKDVMKQYGDILFILLLLVFPILFQLHLLTILEI